MRKYDLEDRLVAFASKVIQLGSNLPKNFAAIHLSKQITRSGTSPALNYAEAQSAESPKDFVHKLKVALKELRETYVNLKILKTSKLVSAESIKPIMKENDELIAIFVKSINTAQRRNI